MFDIDYVDCLEIRCSTLISQIRARRSDVQHLMCPKCVPDIINTVYIVFTSYTVYTVCAVYTVYTAYRVYTVCTVYTVYTVYTLAVPMYKHVLVQD